VSARDEAAPGIVALAGTGERRRWSAPLSSVWRFARREPLGGLGAGLFALMIVVALLAPVLAPHDPLEVRSGFAYLSPGSQAWLGTDKFGRDILSRVMYGARISLYVGLLTVIFGTTFGLLVGLFSGYAGGGVDTAIQRVVDSFQAFPTLILALAVVAALGQHLNNVVFALAIVTWPGASRVVRSAVLSQKQMVYVEAARAAGARPAAWGSSESPARAERSCGRAMRPSAAGWMSIAALSAMPR